MENLFPELASYVAADYQRIGTDRPVLMIAMTARTGSSHLCSGLSSVLPIGKPTELFNARDTLTWETKRRGVSTFEDLLKQYYAESEERIVFKTSWSDFSYFVDTVSTMFPNLQIAYLNRLDTEAQAVSLFKAVVTGQWHDSPTIRKEGPLAEDELNKRFDLVRICQTIGNLEREKRAWEEFFFDRELQPARVNYESFQTDLARAVRAIASYLDLGDVDVSSLHSDFNVLSDKVNDDWLMKVRNYRNGNFFVRYRAGELEKKAS